MFEEADGSIMVWNAPQPGTGINPDGCTCQRKPTVFNLDEPQVKKPTPLGTPVWNFRNEKLSGDTSQFRNCGGGLPTPVWFEKPAEEARAQSPAL